MIKNRLYKLKCETLKKKFRTHLFLCVGNHSYFNIPTSEYINIKSGTLVAGAIWNSKDVEEIEITPELQKQIDIILEKPKSKRFIDMITEK